MLEAPEIPTKLSKVKATKKIAAYQLTDAVSKLQEIAEITNYEEDQFSKFANHIASQLRELPLTHSIILQDKIQLLVTLERLNALASSTSQSFQIAPHFSIATLSPQSFKPSPYGPNVSYPPSPFNQSSGVLTKSPSGHYSECNQQPMSTIITTSNQVITHFDAHPSEEAFDIQ